MKNNDYKKMVFTSNDEQIIFDDFVDNTEEYDSYFVEMCSYCCNKYKDILDNRIDDGTAYERCSVQGCENVAENYVDFDKNEVSFI